MEGNHPASTQPEAGKTQVPTSTAKPKLQAQDVTVIYVNTRTGQRTFALNGITLDVYPGEFVSIVGPSGCGKSTFLNCVDGLLRSTRGRIILDGKEVTGPGRDRAVVFQSPSLLPWRTVLGNIVYGLELQKIARREALDRVRQVISLVGLTGFEHYYPYELSGGMQQRVNLARALVCDPEILLLDEPFANLDAQTREFMQYELLRIWRATRKTGLFVTHQISEAIYLADRVIVFTARPGKVKEIMEIDLPRPRKLGIKRDVKFLEYERLVWNLIEEEARKLGLIVPEEEPL